MHKLSASKIQQNQSCLNINNVNSGSKHSISNISPTYIDRESVSVVKPRKALDSSNKNSDPNSNIGINGNVGVKTNREQFEKPKATNRSMSRFEEKSVKVQNNTDQILKVLMQHLKHCPCLENEIKNVIKK